jgi:PAS domain-containing protein
MHRIAALFRPPRFADEEKTRQAFLLNIILWVLILIPLPLVAYAVLFSPEILNRVWMQAVFGEAVNGFLLVLLRRGHVRSACVIQVATLCLFFTAVAWSGAGIHSQAYQIGQPLIISIAGFLLGVKGALIMVGMSLLSGALMVAVADTGLLTFGPMDKGLTIWVVSAFLFPILAVLPYMAGRLLRTSLAETRMSQERYRNLVEHLPQRIFIKDLNSVYVSCNTNYAQDLGIQPDQIVGRDDFAFYPKALAEAYRADDRAVMAGGVPKPPRKAGRMRNPTSPLRPLWS